MGGAFREKYLVMGSTILWVEAGEVSPAEGRTWQQLNMSATDQRLQSITTTRLMPVGTKFMNHKLQ